MKVRWFISWMLLVFIVNCQFTFGQILSIEAAKNAVNRFEGKAVGFLKGRLIEINGKKFYHLQTTTGDEYRVDAQTGEVLGVIYGSIPLPNVPQDNPPLDTLPLSKLRSIAWAVAEQRYSQFRTKNMHLYEPFWNGYFFWFQFQERLPNGALTGNFCLIGLLPDGQLYSYMAKKVEIPPEANQIPKISPERAIELARRAAKLTEVIEVRSQKLIYQNRRLEWVISIFGPSPRGYYSGSMVRLDANSGRTIEAAPYKLLGHEMPPRGHIMMASRRGIGILLKREFGPIRYNDLTMVRAEIVEALGGKVITKGRDIVISGDRELKVKKHLCNRQGLYLPLEELKNAFHDTIEEVNLDRKRNAVVIFIDYHKFKAIQYKIQSMRMGARTKEIEREFGLN